MEKENIKDILDKVDSGRFTERDEQIAKYWLFQLHSKDRAQLPESALDAASEQIWRRLEDGLSSRNKTLRLWRRILVAAAAVACVVIGGYLFNSWKNNQTNTALAANDITPGTMGATLTLANGKQVKLDHAANGNIANEAGVVITKTADGQLVYEIKETGANAGKMNTLSTAPGETYRLRLPDGSLVWLNAASSLTYAANLSGISERSVKLDGEAYFEVAKHKIHPFVVKTRAQEIMVLGTHFNVNAYTDEPSTKTTLLEGRIQISRLLTKKIKNTEADTKIMTAGQQAILTGQSFNISKVETEEAVAWKNGYFRFKSESIEEVMRKLSRWYELEVIYQGDISKEEFSGTISRNKPIRQVLNMLQYSKSVHFKIEGRRVTVTK